jgi:succinyl-CoA synthetase beta subunit
VNIHEYQAKALLRDYGAPVSDGRVVLRAEEAKTAAGALDGPLWVVKAQIHAGGRGKGRFKETDAGEKGGVRIAKSVEEAADEARRMLGRTLVTKQTGPSGKQVNRVYIEDGAGISRELYLALLVDRQTSRVSFVASTEGGMDIEEVAHATPEKILTFSVDPATGYQPFHGRRIAFALGLEGGQVKQCVNADGHALQALRGQGHGDARDQPAHRDRQGRPQVPRRQDGLRRQRDLPPPGHRQLARRDRGGPQGTRRPPSTISTTSRSTARSAAW